MKPDVREILTQMCDAATEVAEHLAGADLAAYEGNRTMRRAVERCVCMVGEAAFRLRLAKSTDLEPLRLIEIERMRHVIVHGDDRMRDDLVYQAATEDCPPLVRVIDALLEHQP